MPAQSCRAHLRRRPKRLRRHQLLIVPPAVLDSLELKATLDDRRIARLAALAITIHIAEAALPSPLPGVKPGLANVITLLSLKLFGLRVAIWVSLLRIVAGSLWIGTFLSPTFVLSLAGGVLSLIVLVLTEWLVRPAPSLLGLSILAAQAHMAGQFTVAYLLFIPHPALFKLLPVLMTTALLFGLVSGTMANAVLKRLKAP